MAGLDQRLQLLALPCIDTACFVQGSSVERSGAAQGLAEVVAVLGPAHLEALLPNVLAACVSRNLYVREGHLTLFKFLPLAIPDAFQVRDTTCTCKHF